MRNTVHPTGIAGGRRGIAAGIIETLSLSGDSPVDLVGRMANRSVQSSVFPWVWWMQLLNHDDRPRTSPGAMIGMFEKKSESLAPRRVFLTRVFFSALAGLVVSFLSLGLGAWGYHVFGGLAWLDALLNAAMILTGMGPVDPMRSESGKLFATFYCLFSGIVFLTLMAIILAPIYHRFLHKFHLDEEEQASGK